MTTDEINSLDNNYIASTYAKTGVCLVSGKGCKAKDADGKEYLDFASGIGVNSLGWADDEWVVAVANQAGTLQHTSNYYTNAPTAQLAQALCNRTGMQKVFLANSGAEANEGAIKAARKYSFDKYGESRHTIISLVNSFHGRTMATLTATGQESFHTSFAPFLPGFVYVPADDIAALENALTDDVCAIIFEVIQGEGGVIQLNSAFLQQMSALCASKDILLIADEVQTGIGRTGTFLACENVCISPDIVTLAKGLAGGLPIGAVLFGQKCANTLGAGQHGSTFGANPVCCAAALVVLNRLTGTFLANIVKKGELFKEKLLKLPGVLSVSGAGLMLGITLAPPLTAKTVAERAIVNGLLCLTAKEKLRFLPPLIITEEEINEGMSIIKQTLEGLQ